jgi:hypothetical protein
MYGPTCPNHGAELSLTGIPGKGICPISGAVFEYKSDDSSGEIRKDLNGNLVPDYKVEQMDGTGG